MKTAAIVVTLAIALNTVALAQNEPRKLNGGMEAEILSMGRSADHQFLTTAMRLSNKGKDTAYLMLIGKEVAQDDKGGVFNTRYSISGIAECGSNNTQPKACIGLPRVTGETAPLQGYTQIDPGRDIVVNFRLRVEGGKASEGSMISFSADVAYRLVSDPAKDTAPDADKLKQVRIMTISFPPRAVADK